MNHYHWQTILQEAVRLNLPTENSRSILREFLQTKILAYLYEQRETEKLQFMGGTALRIVYGSPRFSEDLDFDNLGLAHNDLKRIADQISRKLANEGIKNKVIWKQTGKRAVFIFEALLFELGISGHQAEKLKINFDYYQKRGKIPSQVFFLSRFDVNQRILVNTPPSILAEKIQALLLRKRVIPRDIFDIAWLLSKNFLPDKAVLKKFGLKQNQALINKLISQAEKTKKAQLEKELMPFLFNQESLKLLDFFPDLVKKIGGKR